MRVGIADSEWTLRALVDTGSSACLFPRGVGEALGVDFVTRAGREGQSFRIAGDDRLAVPAYVTLTLDDWPEQNWTIEAWFFVEEWDLPFAILGNHGFLDRWVVSFNRGAGYFLVERPSSFEARVPVDAFEIFQAAYDDDWERPGH